MKWTHLDSLSELLDGVLGEAAAQSAHLLRFYRKHGELEGCSEWIQVRELPNMLKPDQLRENLTICPSTK